MESNITKNKIYSPVSCDLIDHIEILATTKKAVNLIVSNNNRMSVHCITGIIKTWYTMQKEEFIVIGKDIHLRLDNIISINGNIFESGCNL